RGADRGQVLSPTRQQGQRKEPSGASDSEAEITAAGVPFAALHEVYHVSFFRTVCGDPAARAGGRVANDPGRAEGRAQGRVPQGLAQARTHRRNQAVDGRAGACEFSRPRAAPEDQAGGATGLDIRTRAGAPDCGNSEPVDAAAAAQPGPT